MARRLNVLVQSKSLLGQSVGLFVVGRIAPVCTDAPLSANLPTWFQGAVAAAAARPGEPAALCNALGALSELVRASKYNADLRKAVHASLKRILDLLADNMSRPNPVKDAVFSLITSVACHQPAALASKRTEFVNTVMRHLLEPSISHDKKSVKRAAACVRSFFFFQDKRAFDHIGNHEPLQLFESDVMLLADIVDRAYELIEHAQVAKGAARKRKYGQAALATQGGNAAFDIQSKSLLAGLKAIMVPGIPLDDTSIFEELIVACLAHGASEQPQDFNRRAVVVIQPEPILTGMEVDGDSDGSESFPSIDARDESDDNDEDVASDSVQEGDD
nr:hypothetical protein HK105_003506 [Polyrhizophydium stewartii]